MIIEQDRAAFRRDLLAAIERTWRDWGTDRSAEVLTGLCPRRFPLNRAGQMLLSLDEQLWATGRARYLAREAHR